jgi:hypothetical protein
LLARRLKSDLCCGKTYRWKVTTPLRIECIDLRLADSGGENFVFQTGDD